MGARPRSGGLGSYLFDVSLGRKGKIVMGRGKLFTGSENDSRLTHRFQWFGKNLKAPEYIEDYAYWPGVSEAVIDRNSQSIQVFGEGHSSRRFPSTVYVQRLRESRSYLFVRHTLAQYAKATYRMLKRLLVRGRFTLV
jgi:hypothetical protein